MSLSTIFSLSFSLLLKRIDLDLAEQARAERCSFCGGVLHSARYPRKLRGIPDSVAALFTRRRSFCCAEDGCRSRTTPPSVVFQGRRLYFAASVMLASAFASGGRIRRAERLQALFGVDPRTLRRWQQWWCEAFPASPFFRAVSGRFVPPLEASALPRSLLERFTVQGAENLLSALLFLAPMTTGSVSFDRSERWVSITRRARVVTARRGAASVCTHG